MNTPHQEIESSTNETKEQLEDFKLKLGKINFFKN